MPYIMNSLQTPVRTQAHGQWFQFKPGQIKEIQNKDLAFFLSANRGEEGLVSVADDIMDQDHNTTEFKAYIEDRRKEGVQKRIQKLDWVIRNLRESLRYDLQLKGIKSDPLAFASKGELEAINERMGLQEFERIKHLNVADEVRKKLEILDGGSGSPEPTAHPAGRADQVKPAKS